MIENDLKKLYGSVSVVHPVSGTKMIFFGEQDQVVIQKDDRLMFAESHKASQRKFKSERALLKHIKKRRHEELVH